MPRPMGSIEMKSQTIDQNGAFTGFPALFSSGCKPAMALVLIGLPNKNNRGLQFFVKFTGFGPYYSVKMLERCFKRSDRCFRFME